MKGLYEILTEKKWMVSPDFVHGMRKALESNLNTHSAFSKPERTCGFVTAKDSMGNVYYPEEYQISEDGVKVRGQWALHDEDEQNFPFVSVLTVDGPITRNGVGCSYGSIEHRDMMIAAANHPLCRGHVFIIDTPGGSAWAKNDYEQAINYARSKGQPVIAFIDGMCASAGMYLASLCDERYYMHPKNQIGCIGVMAAFYTEADGSQNKFTNETYHELYDPESFDKNRSYRDVANDNDTKALVAELAELGVEFRSDVQKACPGCTDEHLHGNLFYAEEVKGALVDGQSDFLGCVQRAFALNRGEAAPIVRESSTATQSSSPNTQATNTQTTIDMNNYPLTQAALGVEELVVTEEGTFLNVALLDANEKALADKDAAITEANEKVANAEKALADAQAHSKEMEEQLATALNDKEEADKTLAGKDDEIKALADAKAQLEADLKGAKDALATAEQSLADKDAQIAKLTSAPAKAEGEGESPANNGAEPQTPAEEGADYPTWDGKESMTEFRARKAAWLKSHGL